jgi:glycosyltransferase involved in cell wall biosynthesis
MRITMVCRKYSGVRSDAWAPSGTPAVLRLIEELEERAHDTTVLFLSKSDDSGEPRDIEVDYGGRFRHVRFQFVRWRGFRSLPAIVSDLINDVRQFAFALRFLLRGADIVYFDRAHLGFASVVSLFHGKVVWRCLGVMSFLIARDSGKLLGAIYLGLARLLVRLPIRLMVCTNDGSPWYRLFPRSALPRLLLVTNGVDKILQDPDALPRAIPVIGFVGRATSTKGLDIFAATCCELAKRNVGFRAVVIGDGPLRARAEAIVREAGIGGLVDFVGAVPYSEIARHFAEIDIYVTPARNGAFSNTTLEALCAGCAVVALSPREETGVDATTRHFLPDVIDWVDRDYAVQACADAIQHILSEPGELARRKRMITAFARASLSTWHERIREEVQILEKLAADGQISDQALPADRLARAALEVSGA